MDGPRDQDYANVYDRKAKLYDQSGIAALGRWRSVVISKLNLKAGDTVVDIGCGTGLNFADLVRQVTSSGRIIGVDFSEGMLEQARRRIKDNNWGNIELVQQEAGRYEFPNSTDGIISAFALSFIPHAAQVIENGVKALKLGGRSVVLDMAWPKAVPRWVLHAIPQLSAFGVTDELITKKPWIEIQAALTRNLSDVNQFSFWLGFFYIAWRSKEES